MTTTRNENSDQVTCTVRELGGEIWSEIFYLFEDRVLDWKAKQELVDVIMGVLARHAGNTLLNDSDMPVTPRPKM